MKPAWREMFELRGSPSRRAFLDALHVGEHLARDPYEVTNVIGQPAHREALAALRMKLRGLVAEAVGL